MSSGGLLLLLGVLTLWAELTPVSGQGRPGVCNHPADHGPCQGYFPRFYYNSTLSNCQVFIYGGCRGNANNFKTRDECQSTCVEKPGMCPPWGPQRGPLNCQDDWDCPRAKKCCRYGSLAQCIDVLDMIYGSATGRPTTIGTTVQP